MDTFTLVIRVVSYRVNTELILVSLRLRTYSVRLRKNASDIPSLQIQFKETSRSLRSEFGRENVHDLFLKKREEQHTTE